MALEIVKRLWTPDGALRGPRKKRYVCAVPGCDHPAMPMETHEEQRAAERHVLACIKKHEAEIQEQFHEHDQNPFLRVQDKEKYGWLRRRFAESGAVERFTRRA